MHLRNVRREKKEFDPSVLVSRTAVWVLYNYRVTGQDAIHETEKWAEWAILTSAADSAHFSISCMVSCPVTLYMPPYKISRQRHLLLGK